MEQHRQISDQKTLKNIHKEVGELNSFKKIFRYITLVNVLSRELTLEEYTHAIKISDEKTKELEKNSEKIVIAKEYYNFISDLATWQQVQLTDYEKFVNTISRLNWVDRVFRWKKIMVKFIFLMSREAIDMNLFNNSNSK